MAWFDTDNLRTILETETDYDSPVAELLMAQLRKNFESLLMMLYYTGDSGSLTTDPPDDTTGLMTDGGAAYDTNGHQGKTVLMITGNGAGNMYLVASNAPTTFTITSTNLYDDGLRSGDTYNVMYTINGVAMTGHDHDGTNSALITAVADDSIVTDSIVDLNVTNPKLAANCVTTDKILDNTILSGDMSASLESDEIVVIDQEDSGYKYTITVVNGVITTIVRAVIP